MKIAKNIVPFLLICAIIFTFCMSSYALPEQASDSILILNLPGTIHADGSYQFSDSEFAKLKEFTAMQESSKSAASASYADMLIYSAPAYYATLPREVKRSIEVIPFISSNGNNNSPMGTTYGSHNNWATINKSGNSLFLESGITQNVFMPGRDGYSNVFMMVDCLLRSSSGVDYAYSNNYKAYNFEVVLGTLKASLYYEPPTGSYKNFGFFTYPYITGSGNLDWINTELHTAYISYVFPY